MDIKLLIKYLDEDCSADERKSVTIWLQESESNQRNFDDLRKLWKATSQLDLLDESYDTDVEWIVLQQRIEDESRERQVRSVNRSSWLSLYNPVLPTLSKIAAVFLIVALTTVFIFDRYYIPVEEVSQTVLKEISMDKGHRGKVTLSDGTKVYINSDSRITIPNRFKANIREVYLEGEAYFDVTEDPNKPFIISTKGAKVEVLGTSFSVKNYPDDTIIQTVVEEGTVSFSSADNGHMNEVILTAGNLGRLNTEDNVMQKAYVGDVQSYLSWMSGYLTFKDESMKDVAKQLERKYDIEVVFDSKEISEMNLTAELRSRSLERVIKTISMSLKIDYTIEQGRVSFSLGED